MTINLKKPVASRKAGNGSVNDLNFLHPSRSYTTANDFPGLTGFTLFEVLVAVSIFAIIGTMAMANLIQVGRSGERVSQSQQQLAEIQFALGYLGKDLSQLANRKIRDQYGDEHAPLKISDQTLTFTRSGWSNLLQQARSNLQRVEYRLVDTSLQRIYWPQLDQAYTEIKIEQSLLQNVEGFEIKLLTRGKEKLDSWPIDQPNEDAQKPVAIELTLELSGFGRIQRIYEIVYELL